MALSVPDSILEDESFEVFRTSLQTHFFGFSKNVLLSFKYNLSLYIYLFICFLFVVSYSHVAAISDNCLSWRVTNQHCLTCFAFNLN